MWRVIEWWVSDKQTVSEIEVCLWFVSQYEVIWCLSIIFHSISMLFVCVHSAAVSANSMWLCTVIGQCQAVAILDASLGINLLTLEFFNNCRYKESLLDLPCSRSGHQKNQHWPIICLYIKLMLRRNCYQIIIYMFSRSRATLVVIQSHSCPLWAVCKSENY